MIFRFYLFWLVALLSYISTIANSDAQATKLVDTLIAYKHYKIGDSLLNARDFDTSIENFKKARVIYQQAKVWDRVASCYNKISRNFSKKSQYESSLNASNTALKICEKYLEINHLEKARAYDNLGLLHEFYSFKYKKALDYFQRAFKIKEAIFCKDHSEIVKSIVNFAEINEKLENYEKALILSYKALNLQKKIYKEKGETVYNNYSYTYLLLGNIYSDMFKIDSAIHFYKNSIVTNKKPLIKKLLFWNFHNLSKVYTTKGDLSLAKKNARKYLDLKLQYDKNYHKNLAISYNQLGIINNRQRKYNKAIEYYKKAFSIYDSLYGQNSMKASDLNNNLGVVYKNKKLYNKAFDHFKKSILIIESNFGNDVIKLARPYCNFGNIYYYRKEYDKALVYNFKALEIRKKKLTINHPDISDSHNYIGKIYEAQKNYTKASSNYEKALKGYQKTYGKLHPHLAETYNYIAGIHQKQNKLSTSLDFYRKALIPIMN